MPPKLSIIIPVYNAEKFLGECIDSVLAQTFTDYEIILVDDGSTDESGNICDQYVLRLPDRIKVVHKLNGGAASARNAGLAEARGEYIGFVDGDDTILPDMYRILMENMISYDADIVESCFIQSGIKNNDAQLPRLVSGRDALIEMFKWKVTTSLCTKLFRKSAIENIIMDEGHTNEDFRYLCDVFVSPVKVVLLSDSFYLYRYTPSSVTRVMRPAFFDIFRNLDYVETLLPADDKELRELFVHYSMTMHIMSGVKIVKGRLNKTYKAWLRKNRRFIRNNFQRVIFPGKLSLRWRIKACFTFLRLF